MTQVIEIVVIGGTGSGKSHVLDVIDYALRHEYGPDAQIVSHELSRERRMGRPGAKPCVPGTIFNLKEQGVAAAGQSLGGLKIEIDTSDTDSALGQVEALQGFTTGYATDPLESAISSTLAAIRDERESGSGLSLNDHFNRDATLSILGGHLIRLLELQVTQLNEPTVIERSQAGDVTFTELTTGRQ
jgi:energy-coupling factor transporter ATP-binding protein EcfA2